MKINSSLQLETTLRGDRDRAMVQIIAFVGGVDCIGDRDSAHGMHVLSHVPNLAGKLACTCSLIFEELEPAIESKNEWFRNRVYDGRGGW